MSKRKQTGSECKVKKKSIKYESLKGFVVAHTNRCKKQKEASLLRDFSVPHFFFKSPDMHIFIYIRAIMFIVVFRVRACSGGGVV